MLWENVIVVKHMDIINTMSFMPITTMSIMPTIIITSMMKGD